MTAVAPTTILSSFTKTDLFKIAEQEGILIADKSTKPRIVEAICHQIEDLGIKQLTSQLKKVELEEITQPVKMDLTSKGANSITKPVLRKRLTEVMEEQGVENFLRKYAEVEVLSSIVKSLGEEPCSKTKEKLVEQAVRLINFVGFQTLFGRFDTPYLHHLMDELKLKYDTDSKQKIVFAMATQTNAKKEKAFGQEVVFSKTKQPIKKGISYQDIYQHYLRDELFDWCKDNGLKVSGNKKEVIHRILDFLDGDKENTMAASNVKEEKPAKKETAKKEKEVKEAPAKEKEAAKKEKKAKEASAKEKEATKKEEAAKKRKKETEEAEEEAPPKKGTKESKKDKAADKKKNSKPPKEESSDDE